MNRVQKHGDQALGVHDIRAHDDVVGAAVQVWVVGAPLQDPAANPAPLRRILAAACRSGCRGRCSSSSSVRVWCGLATGQRGENRRRRRVSSHVAFQQRHHIDQICEECITSKGCQHQPHQPTACSVGSGASRRKTQTTGASPRQAHLTPAPTHACHTACCDKTAWGCTPCTWPGRPPSTQTSGRP